MAETPTTAAHVGDVRALQKAACRVVEGCEPVDGGYFVPAADMTKLADAWEDSYDKFKVHWLPRAGGSE